MWQHKSGGGWLSNKTNQTTLALIGSGLAVVMGGAWQVYLYISPLLNAAISIADASEVWCADAPEVVRPGSLLGSAGDASEVWCAGAPKEFEGKWRGNVEDTNQTPGLEYPRGTLTFTCRDGELHVRIDEVEPSVKYIADYKAKFSNGIVTYRELSRSWEVHLGKEDTIEVVGKRAFGQEYYISTMHKVKLY